MNNHIFSQANEGKITMTHDPRKAIQFSSKKAAIAASKAIHWPANSAASITVMGFAIWTIGDDHQRYLTPTGYAVLAQELGAPIAPHQAPMPAPISENDLANAIMA